MYPKSLLRIVTLIMAIALVVPLAYGQETTAGLQGVVKDGTGAVVAKAVVEVTSPALIGIKKMETDASGYYRFANLPPGTYILTVTAPNFRTYKQEGIALATGRLPSIDVVLQVGMQAEVVEVSGEAPLVDVTQSKVQTNITAKELQDLPKGLSYQSLIQLAPGARNEPLQAPTGGNAITPGFSNHQGTNQGNGYQVDGASNTESSYLVEGMETASAFDGASATNVPMEFIQEVQVKSSGFEAEHGGALGGVVNVMQKRGSNEWHGSIFTYYSGDAFDSAPNRALRDNPLTKASSTTRVDQQAEFFQAKKDQYRIVQPGFTLGGNLVKDRLWVFGAFEPRVAQLSRTVLFDDPAIKSRTFHENINTYYSLGRIDALPTQKIRLFGSWQYGYERGTGTTLPGADSTYGQRNTSAANSPDNYNSGIGYTAPNVLYGVGADITINPNLVATTRFGYFYTDYQDRGTPTGLRYIYRNTNYNYSTASAVNANAAFLGIDAVTPLDSQFYHSTGWSNIGANQATLFDKLKRWNFNQDLAYFKKFAGTHNFKVGYGFNKNSNDTFNSYLPAQVYVAYGLPYTPASGAIGDANCNSIINTNVATYSASWLAKNPATAWIAAHPTQENPDGTTRPSTPQDFFIASTGCQGLFGTVNIRDGDVIIGKAEGWNHAIYAQDAWTVGRGLTINAGVRFEKESIPSYLAANKGIDFDWTQKVAPRLGAAWDVFNNGKLKVYGSFGYFYQVMNLQLARGSFGGDYWHDCVYALDTPNFNQIVPTLDSAGHFCPLGGGNAQAVGTFPAGGMRFIENYDYRTPSNDPTSFGSFGITGAVDPNLEPMKQHEMVFGADYALKPTLGLELRYSRKRLDRTIEDAGVLTPDGEAYYIVNPGYHADSILPDSVCAGCPAMPKANRRYDGLETRLTYRGTGKWFGSLSYTYSRYYGNYSGLTATDQSDSNRGGGRNGANTDRAFDEPFMSFNPAGKVIDGPLSTDRPHTFKAYGFYRLKWWKMETRLGGVQQWYSGTPLTSYMSVWGAPVFVENRGVWADITRDSNGNWVLNGTRQARTPSFSQSDFSLVHEMHVSKTNENLVAGFEVNIFNLFNQHSVVDINGNLIASSGNSNIHPAGGDYASMIVGGYNYISQANSTSRPIILNSMYGQPYIWQNPRAMRFKFKFTF